MQSLSNHAGNILGILGVKIEMKFCTMCRSPQIDHFYKSLGITMVLTRILSAAHCSPSSQTLHFLTRKLSQYLRPAFRNWKDVVLQPIRSPICHLKAPEKETSMSRCFHWRIHKLQRINTDFTNLFRKIADNRVLSSSLFKVGMILMPR